MLHTWFTDSAAKWPDEPALAVASQQYTYAQLDALSSGIAARLREQAGPRPIAGLLAARSVSSYAAYLAVLRLGGVVVPLNDAHPPERLKAVATAAGLDVVIADREQSAAFARELAVPVARFGAESVRALSRSAVTGDEHSDSGDEHSDPGDELGDPEDLAYIMFTSGSTGRPKGVPIRHRNVEEFLRHNIARYAAGPGSRFSQTFHLTFDPSVFDLFVAWGSGATLVVPSADDLFDPVAFVNRERITHWYSVPSVVSMAAAAGLLPAGSMPSLRWSLFCGEQLSAHQARAWSDAAPDSVVENLYGPTELTVTVTAYRLPADRAAWPDTPNGTVPIGEVYPHMEYRVDPETSELEVRGPQRFSGYLDPRDDEDRFSGGPRAEAWYRTGDRVAVGEGGLVHLGRVDEQVKILGQRVELQEIEAALCALPGVEAAIASVVVDAHGVKAIAAVYTGRPASARDLRVELMKRLPTTVVPKRFVHVDSIPLNERGKIDRAACARLVR